VSVIETSVVREEQRSERTAGTRPVEQEALIASPQRIRAVAVGQIALDAARGIPEQPPLDTPIVRRMVQAPSLEPTGVPIEVALLGTEDQFGDQTPGAHGAVDEPRTEVLAFEGVAELGVDGALPATEWLQAGRGQFGQIERVVRP